MISEKSPSKGIIEEIHENINKELMDDFNKMAEGKMKIEDKEIENFIKLYRIANNYEKRNKEGIKPVIPFLKEIEEVWSLKDLNDKAVYFQLNDYELPFNFNIGTDEKESDKKNLYFNGLQNLLPDLSYYEADSKEGESYRKDFSKLLKEILISSGKTEEEAERMLSNIFQLDKYIVDNYFPKDKEEDVNEEEVNTEKNYIPFDEFKKYSKNIDFEKIVKELLGVVPDKVIVDNTKYLENIDKIINNKNLQSIKDWMYLKKVSHSLNLLSEDLMKQLNRVYELNDSGLNDSGLEEEELVEEDNKLIAYNISSNFFDESIGNYYGKKSLDQEAKKDIENMTKDIIKAYKERLKKNDWLSDKTKAEAIKKLDAIKIQIGYSEEKKNFHNEYEIDTNKSLFENISNLNRISKEYMYKNFSKPVKKDGFIMPAYTVNAAYEPLVNTICLPAGILQAPFYSKENSVSKNYGGIGAIIGHEIAHAFDSEGALYDKDGKLNNWWTDEDFKKFENRIEKVEKLFDKIEYAGGKIDGKNTLCENIADESGLRVALESLKAKDKNPDLKEFFSGWSESWKMKATQETEKQSLENDEHSPAKVRANIQLSNMEEFINLYNIKSGDGMYLAPEERISVW